MSVNSPALVWEDLSSTLPASRGWMHSGVAVEADGTIICAHPEGHGFLRISPSGVTTSVVTSLTELHSIVRTGWSNTLGVADPGHRFVPAGVGDDYGQEQVPGRAALINATTGDIVLELQQPNIPEYEERAWSPTSIAVDDEPQGSGDIWVADGYAASLLHRYSETGEYIATYDGRDSGKPFDCPHGIAIRSTGDGNRELFVADRTNQRVVVLTREGTFIRSFGEGDLDSPSSIAFVGDELYITELFGGVAHFTIDGRLVGTLEPSRTRDHEETGWPNVYDDAGTPQRPTAEPMNFNSPHGITHHNGVLYITEWHIGGRLLRLSLLGEQ